MSIAQRLQLVIDEKNISQAEAGRKAGIDSSKISKILSGDTKKPYRSTLSKIAKGLQINIEWLITGEGFSAPTKYQTYDMSGSGHYQLDNKAQGDIAQGNIIKGGLMELTPVEQSLINLNRAMGNEDNLKGWINELTNPNK